jgi:hypothetical protein
MEVINYKVVHKSTIMDSIFPSDIRNLIGIFVGESEFYEDCFEPIEDWSKKFWDSSDYYGEEDSRDYEFDAIELKYGESDYFLDVICQEKEYNVYENDDDFNNMFDDDNDDDDDLYDYKYNRKYEN